MCGEPGPGPRCRRVRARYIRLGRKLRHRHHHGIQKLLPIAIFVAASVKFVAESAIKWTRGGRAALAMAMCPRENDVSAISRKFAGITRVFSPPLPLPLYPSFCSARCVLARKIWATNFPRARYSRARANERKQMTARERISPRAGRARRRGTRVCFRFAYVGEHRLSIF